VHPIGTFYDTRVKAALREAIAEAVRELLAERKISEEDARSILKTYDVERLFRTAERQAGPGLEELLSGGELLDDGTKATTIVRCNGGYHFANQCE